MHPRIKLAHGLLKLGSFIQSSAVAVMRPDDLIEFSRRHYLKPSSIQGWSSTQTVNTGLSSEERSLLEKTGMKRGRLLLLGVGGGREAIPLAKMGFTVTGIDFVAELVERAKENAQKNGVEVSGLVQEISRLKLPERAFDMVWLSAAMYSCVPTRARRIKLLQSIFSTLEPTGYFVFGFFWNPKSDASPIGVIIKKAIAWLTLSNLHYEKGDMLRFNLEFIHAFTSLEELKAEIIQGGFEFVDIQAIDEKEFAGAIARKPF